MWGVKVEFEGEIFGLINLPSKFEIMYKYHGFKHGAIWYTGNRLVSPNKFLLQRKLKKWWERTLSHYWRPQPYN